MNRIADMSEEKKKPTLFLIDGSNYVYRAYYAIRHLSNSTGFPTNAVYGFTAMLMKLLREEKPDYIAVAFDLKGPTFRDEVYEHYKANRAPTPDALIPQIPYIKKVVEGFSIPVLEMEGIEADDVIGTLAKAYAGKGLKVVIVSGDKDLLQLVSENIVVVDTMKDKVYDVEGVKERFGVTPDRIIDVLALMGDASDNVPGVPGVGDKTAKKLIAEFGSLDGVMENLNKVSSEKIRESIRHYAQQARLGRQLVTIMTDADVEFDLEQARFEGPNPLLLRELFKELEFSSFLKELSITENGLQGDYRLVLNEDEVQALVRKLKNIDQLAINIESDSEPAMLADIVGIAISCGEGEAYYIPVGHQYPGAPDQMPPEKVLQTLSPILSCEEKEKHGHDLKNILISLLRKGFSLNGLGCDTKIAAYVLNPSKKNYGLEVLARDVLNRELPSLKELLSNGAKPADIRGVSVERALDYSCRRVDAVQRLSSALSHQIEKEGFGELFHAMEMPLIEVLANMERHGVLVDIPALQEMSEQFERLLASSEEKIFRLAGEKFNINSPKQLQQILFEKLKLPRGRKTKGGYSTDGEVLLALAQSHELPAEILAFRSIAKLKSTYVDVLPILVNPKTGRIHTSYNQAGTETGRLSSSNPNLQNIPIRTTEGKRIRQAFIVPPDFEILSADYSQIDLRVLAHISGDRHLIEAFHSGADIHSRTAADIFGVFPEIVTPEMRRQAKVVNFGIIYGMSAFGLAKELGVSQTVARAYIEEYFSRYSGVHEYIEKTLAEARKKGYVTTLMDRRRYLPEINSPNPAIRQFAERTAINTPIQGTSADLIKIAMIRIDAQLKKGRFSSGMIMQVHDELIFEAALQEKDELADLVRAGMEEAAILKVPLQIGMSWGANWDQAH